MPNPLCFVLMPLGRKPSPSVTPIDFDAVYAQLIKPAIVAAGLDPVRADESQGGATHKLVFDQLILSEYAVVDLTTDDAKVFYTLGMRQALKPATTVCIAAEGADKPLFVETLTYQLGVDGKPSAVETDRAALVEQLRKARQRSIQRPLFQLVEKFPEIQRLKTDVFRDQVQYSDEVKAKLAAARKQGLDAVKAVERDIGRLEDVESGVWVDLLLSYRAVKGWREMIELVGKMPRPLAASILVREQLAFALNRAGRGEEAEALLLNLIRRYGPSSETCGLLGRVYKDRREAAEKAGDSLAGPDLLDKAIDAYLSGFEADWRDAYPGVNAVTLMELKDPPDPRRLDLIPVVRYAVERRVAAGKPDYWDHATLLELAVLAKDTEKAMAALADALAMLREPWEAETTARNLRLIREARERRGEPWHRAPEIENALENRP